MATGVIATGATGATTTTLIITTTTSNMGHGATKRMGWHKTHIKIHSAQVCHPPPNPPPRKSTPPPF